MVFDYFILKEISKYCNDNFSGSVLTDIFSQDKDKVVFTFQLNKSANNSIEFSCSNEFPYIRIIDEYKKSKKNTVKLMSEVLDNTLSRVSLYNNDRVLLFAFKGGKNILFSMIPSRYNALLVENEIVITSFKNSNKLIGSDIKEYFRLKTTFEKKELKSYRDYLKKHNPKLNSQYISEICYRCQVSEKSAISEDKLGLLNNETEKINNELVNPVFLKYSNDGNSFHSLLELKSTDFKKEKFDSIIALSNSLITENLYNTYLIKRKNEILGKYRGKIESLKKKIESIDKNIEHNTQSSIYREYGEQIYSNLITIKKGDNEFIYNTGSKIIVIKLNKEFSPQQNAEYYFAKYKKQKNSIIELKRKKELLNRILEKEIIEFNEIFEISNLKKIKKMHKEEFDEKEETEKKYFRKFILNESFQVWVGKDSYSNDLLTMRYSSPHDYWFHVRGATGSHTVLKINNRTLNPEKEIIKIAASIAAYYSKARNASNVPVAYCERKYVKKIKGLKQGSVIMEREKIVNVKPEIPKLQDES